MVQLVAAQNQQFIMSNQVIVFNKFETVLSQLSVDDRLNAENSTAEPVTKMRSIAENKSKKCDRPESAYK